MEFAALKILKDRYAKCTVSLMSRNTGQSVRVLHLEGMQRLAGCIWGWGILGILASPSIPQLVTSLRGSLEDEEAQVHLLSDSLVPVPTLNVLHKSHLIR